MEQHEPTHPWRIYTDLDGSLLDHHTYDWLPAKPWLYRLTAQGIPLIPNTSKTAAEVAEWLTELKVDGYAVVENGGMVLLPNTHVYWHTHLPHWTGREVSGVLLGRSYDALCAWLDDVRRGHGFDFRGFHDVDPGTIVQWTSLSPDEAVRAQQRQSSEPLLWEGSRSSLQQFITLAQAADLQVQQGGRFLHISDHTTKATGMAWLEALWGTAARTLALGDGGNDIPMLEAADRAVAICNAKGTHVNVQQPYVYFTQHAGPEGWSEGLSYWLSSEEQQHG